MIGMLDRAVANDDKPDAKQIVSKYFNEAKLAKRFIEITFDKDEKDVTMKEMVYHMLDGKVAQLLEKKKKGKGVNVSAITKMTDRNDHVGALIAGAKFLKQKKLEKVFMGIKMIQDAEGSLTQEVQTLRMKYYTDMMKFAKQKLSHDDYEQFYQAY